MRNRDLSRRALIDLKQVQMNLDMVIEDEYFLDAAAYHLQQAVEKLLKFKLTISGKEFYKKHKIFEICKLMDSYGIAYPEWIYLNTETLTSYGEDTGYSECVIGDERKIRGLMNKAFDYYDEILKYKQG